MAVENRAGLDHDIGGEQPRRDIEPRHYGLRLPARRFLALGAVGEPNRDVLARGSRGPGYGGENASPPALPTATPSKKGLGAGGMATVSRPSVAYTPAPLAGTPSWIHLWD